MRHGVGMKKIIICGLFIFSKEIFSCSVDPSFQKSLVDAPEKAVLAVIVKLEGEPLHRKIIVEKGWTRYLKEYPLNDRTNCFLPWPSGHKYLFLSNETIESTSNNFRGFASGNGVLIPIEESQKTIKKLNEFYKNKH